MCCHLGQLHQVEDWPRTKFKSLQGAKTALASKKKRRAGVTRRQTVQVSMGGMPPIPPKNGVQIERRQSEAESRRPGRARAEHKAGAQVGHRLEQNRSRRPGRTPAERGRKPTPRTGAGRTQGRRPGRAPAGEQAVKQAVEQANRNKAKSKKTPVQHQFDDVVSPSTVTSSRGLC